METPSVVGSLDTEGRDRFVGFAGEADERRRAFDAAMGAVLIAFGGRLAVDER
jgi:hypothetical protein